MERMTSRIFEIHVEFDYKRQYTVLTKIFNYLYIKFS